MWFCRMQFWHVNSANISESYEKLVRGTTTTKFSMDTTKKHWQKTFDNLSLSISKNNLSRDAISQVKVEADKERTIALVRVKTDEKYDTTTKLG